jgi:hypothetical protein
MGMSLDHWWNDINRERRSTRIKTRISATLFTTIATWGNLGLNAGLLGESSANDRQSHGAATEEKVTGAVVLRFSSYCTVNTFLVVCKVNHLMLYREIVAVCSKTHRIRRSSFCEQNVEFLNLK